MVKLLVKAPAMCCVQQGQKNDMTSYPIPTGSAIIGMVNSAYGKPEVNWAVRFIKVLNKIDRVRMKFNGVNGANHEHSPVCGDYIANCAYIIGVEALVPDYPDNAKARETIDLRKKHEEILLRRITRCEAGSRRGFFYLGKHSYHCTIEPAPENEPKSYYEGKRPMVFRSIPYVQSFTPVPDEELALMGVGKCHWNGGRKVVKSPHDGRWYYSNFHYTDLVMVDGIINFDPRLYQRHQTNCVHHSQNR